MILMIAENRQCGKIEFHKATERGFAFY